MFAGLKTPGVGVLDLGILVSDRPATVAGTFSRNKILSPSVTVTRSRVPSSSARGVVANSGCANCSVGEQGVEDALDMTRLAEAQAGVGTGEMMVASTGVIGVELPMALIRGKIGDIELTDDGGPDFARSIMDDGLASKAHRRSVRCWRQHLHNRRCGEGCGHDPSRHGHHALFHNLRRIDTGRLPAEVAERGG